MAQFLVDVNLPRHFSLWNNDMFIHQLDINDEWSDEEIWDYAKTNNLTIITKDKDFSYRILFSEPPPRIIHIRFGNLKMRDFFQVIHKHWELVAELNHQFKLVNLYLDRVEGFN